MSSHVSFDSTHPSLLSAPANAVHPTALGPLTFTNYSPRRIQACLDSTIMTYLQQQQQGHHQQQQQQQQQQQPPPLPPQALALQQQQIQQHQLLLQQHQQQQQQLLRNQQQLKQQARCQQLSRSTNTQQPQQPKQKHSLQQQQELLQQQQQEAYHQHRQLQKQQQHQHHQMQNRISPKNKTNHLVAHRSSKDPSSAHQLVHPTDEPNITFAPRSPRDQTRKQELILPKADKGQQPRHDSLYSPEAPLHLLRATPARNNAPIASSGEHDNEEEYHDEEEDDDDSEYDEDSMDDEDESELDDSDIDDDDYSDSGSDHTETESSTRMSVARNDPHRIAPISSETTVSHPAANNTNNSNAVPLTTTPDLPSKDIHPISAQRAQQEVVKQLTLAAGAWNINPDSTNVQESYCAEYSSTESNSSSNSNHDRSISSTDAITRVRDNGMDKRVLMLETVRPQDGGPLSSTVRRPPSRGHAFALPPLPSTDTPTTRMSHQQQQQQLQQQKQQRIAGQGITSSRSSASESFSSPGDASQVAKARMLPYVEDDAEDEDEYSGEDEDEDMDEDDYSYSEDEDEEEDDDEDEDSSSEYHYGAKEDPANRANKPRAPPPGQYTRSNYSHYRPPRLDENYLRKRAITKQVVRRSSLTALLGEVSQPAPPPLTLQAKNFTIHPNGSPLSYQAHQSAQVARRPGLVGVWPEPGQFPEPLSAHYQEEHTGLKPYSGSSDSGRTVSTVSGLRSGSNLSEQNHRLMLGPNAAAAVLSQEPNRPRRTDSGVEVKVPSHQHRSSGSGSSDSRSLNERPSTRWADTSMVESSSSVQSSNGQGSSQIPTITIIPARRPRMKSEGDAPDVQLSSSVGASSDGLAPASPNGATDVSKIVKQPLKSSISCHTFPRAAGKRVGRKHVSWHHSLFPTERVLRVKPSIPSLSNVAIESAEATLSQLPTIPVMARDNVKDFHQSIRSLRTLSRDEIAKMSYKQQGRQELTSTVPISKSAHDSTSWWSISRWLKGPPAVDKRHWKPDSSRETCAYCFAPFHRLTNPRHHCRKCGDIFCGKCASAEILMDAKNCVYVQQSQLARWSRRVDIQRHNLWIDTLPQLHPVRTAVESALVAGSGVSGVPMLGAMEGTGSLGHATGVNGGLAGAGMGQRNLNGSGSGGRRGSWQMAPSAMKKSRVSIFGLFGQGTTGTGPTPHQSDSRRGSIDVSAAENVYANHYGHLQPHHSVAFSLGRRSSSSSILRSNSTVGGTGHMMMIGASPLTLSSEGAIAMSRRMSSGGVGEVCLARICVGCERELLKPVPRCTSIAKYYGSLGPRNGARRQMHGYSSLGPHSGRQQHQQQQYQQQHHASPPRHPMDDHADQDLDPTVTAHSDYLAHGVRRHSPLRQTSIYSANVDRPADEHQAQQQRPMSPGGAGTGGLRHQQQQQYHHQQHQQQQQQQHNNNNHNGGWASRDEPVGPHGESRYCPSVLTFQEQQLHYTQQTNGPLSRELC
ncbi:hypothetical protein BGZ47_002123 [Haplosporangium gracile]|nr:hypothetical protein BGZ47_002123 [Haplosporangium gracile]